MRWCYLIAKAIRNHRAAYRALAEMWSKNMPKRLDTKRPYGPTIQGQRWGWREIRKEQETESDTHTEMFGASDVAPSDGSARISEC